MPRKITPAEYYSSPQYSEATEACARACKDREAYRETQVAFRVAQDSEPDQA